MNRSADHIVPYVSLPAVALVALWLTLLRRPRMGVPPAGRRATLAGVVALAVLLVAGSPGRRRDEYPQSALAHVIPGDTSLSTALDRLWDPAPSMPRPPVGSSCCAATCPMPDRSIVLTSADLSVEILMRSGRGNAVPLGDPWEDSFVPEHHLEPLGAFVEGLEGGELMLIDAPGRRCSRPTARSRRATPLPSTCRTRVRRPRCRSGC